MVRGYIARADVLRNRLECCELVARVTSFVGPAGFVESVPWLEELSTTTLGTVASQAVGALHLRSAATKFMRKQVDDELRNRLSFEWVLPDPIPSRRIAWVQGRDDIESIGRAFEAAAALGIRLVILDQPGHWLQDSASPFAHLREDFIELDITPDTGLSQRIAAAVRSYPKPVDGVMTISDVRLTAVAMASEELGLPTERVEAYKIAANKGRTRMLEEEEEEEEEGAEEADKRQEEEEAGLRGGESSRQFAGSFILERPQDLQPFLKNLRGRRGNASGVQLLKFPRVVKPIVGWSSECVFKVRSEAELVAAVQRASDRHAASPTPSTAVVVEPYVDGPEVDVNMVVLDGEILFCEIEDEFPTSADLPGATAWANFEETKEVIPSALPATEQAAIRERVLDSILRQGFRSGIFHCEARVVNSRVGYSLSEEDDGIVDLVPRDIVSAGETRKVEVYLHEINARPAGHLESVAAMLAYGVDYFAIRLLMAIGPSTEAYRLRALTQPFLRGPQFHLSVLIVQQTQAGVMRSPDAVGEFLDAHPRVKANVVDYYSRIKAGHVLDGPDSSARCWVGFLSIISRDSRPDLLRRLEYVARHFSYEMQTAEGQLVKAQGLTSVTSRK